MRILVSDKYYTMLPIIVQLNLAGLLSLFNGQLLFILKFIIEVILVFVAGGIIGKLLHLERAEKSDGDSQYHSDYGG